MNKEWRRLEKVLVAYAKAGGYEVLEKRASGDVVVEVHEFAEINLTDLAKAIAEDKS